MPHSRRVWCQRLAKRVTLNHRQSFRAAHSGISLFMFNINFIKFTHLIDVIQSGWSLRTLTKAVNSRDFDMVANLLSPTGPVIRLCYKLLGDSTIKYEFPISFLPVIF
jgi:hypothetical protein